MPAHALTPADLALLRLAREWQALAVAQVAANRDGRTPEEVAESCPLALGSTAVAEWLMEDGDGRND